MKRISALSLCFWVVLAPFLFPGRWLSAQSHIEIQEEGDLLLEKSDRIFVGRVVSKTSFRDSNGLILTRYSFRSSEFLKGEPVRFLDIVEYGGAVGNEAMSSSNSVGYVEGPEYLVFTHVDALGLNRTSGGSSGSFQVWVDQEGERMIRIPPGHPLSQSLEDRRFLLPLDEVKSGLRSALGRTNDER